MKLLDLSFIGILILMSQIHCQSRPPVPDPLAALPIAEFRLALEDQLLFAWYPQIIDTVNGGYISDLEYDFTPSAKQSKFIVAQTRGLWTAAKALEHYPDNQDFQRAAAHGLRYLQEVMWDHEYGGFHANAPNAASEVPSEKLAYGNAFGIYALAQYAKISDSKEALDLAMETFHWLERTSHDPIHKGYFNQITRSGISANSPQYDRNLFPPASWGDPMWKDQNTSIHLLEAFTTLYEVSHDSLVRVRLEEMMLQIRDQMVHPDGYLRLNFSRELAPISYRDSGRAVVLANHRWDHVTFGHDIETAYLLLEAAHILGWEGDERTERIAKQLVDHSLANGFAADYQGILEEGYYFQEGKAIEIINDHKTWWAQIEALNSLLLMARKYPEEPQYLDAFNKMWRYCRDNFIDQTHGGWYAEGLDQAPEVNTRKKGSAWKTPYHTARGLMNIVSTVTADH